MEMMPELTNPQASVFHQAVILELGSAQRLARYWLSCRSSNTIGMME
jgi:hypothetical protein